MSTRIAPPCANDGNILLAFVLKSDTKLKPTQRSLIPCTRAAHYVLSTFVQNVSLSLTFPILVRNKDALSAILKPAKKEPGCFPCWPYPSSAISHRKTHHKRTRPGRWHILIPYAERLSSVFVLFFFFAHHFQFSLFIQDSSTLHSGRHA